MDGEERNMEKEESEEGRKIINEWKREEFHTIWCYCSNKVSVWD